MWDRWAVVGHTLWKGSLVLYCRQKEWSIWVYHDFPSCFARWWAVEVLSSSRFSCTVCWNPHPAGALPMLGRFSNCLLCFCLGGPVEHAYSPQAVVISAPPTCSTCVYCTAPLVPRAPCNVVSWCWSRSPGPGVQWSLAPTPSPLHSSSSCLLAGVAERLVSFWICALPLYTFWEVFSSFSDVGSQFCSLRVVFRFSCIFCIFIFYMIFWRRFLPCLLSLPTFQQNMYDILKTLWANWRMSCIVVFTCFQCEKWVVVLIQKWSEWYLAGKNEENISKQENQIVKVKGKKEKPYIASWSMVHNKFKNLVQHGSILWFVLYNRYHNPWLLIETLEVTEMKPVKTQIWHAMISTAQMMVIRKCRHFLVYERVRGYCLLIYVNRG